MNPLMNYQVSEFGLLGALIVGIALLVSLRLIQRLFAFWLTRSGNRWRLQYVFPMLEAVVWLFYAGWSIGLIFSDSLYSGLAMLSVLGAAVILITWFAGRDWIAGVVLKVRHAFELEQRIQIGEYNGKVRYIGYLGVDLEKDNGELVKIPFSRINGEIRWLRPPESVAAHSRFELELPRIWPALEAARRVREAILSSPWSSVQREPQVRLAATNADHYVFEAVVYAQETEFLQAIENDVKRYLNVDQRQDQR